jgi:hypothetical protein
VTGGKPIAVLLQSISGVSAINPLVAFYDIHEVESGERDAILLFCPGHHTIQYFAFWNTFRTFKKTKTTLNKQKNKKNFVRQTKRFSFL